ncbi:hypothetical protein P8452_68865 [Trifolium repens]|nr:hypothetical protein P8452_68865 [Trifolium repens]
MNEYPVGISNKDRELSEAQAEIKGLRHSEQLREKVAEEIAKLQDDNKALDRLTKSKEAALIEAEKTVQKCDTWGINTQHPIT